MHFTKPTKEQLYQWYVIEQKGTLEISKIIGCADWTVSCYLKKYDIPRRIAGPKIKDLTGQTFHKLTVIERQGSFQGARRGARWACKCECGEEVITCGTLLLNGGIKDCGRHKKSGSYHHAWKGGKFIPSSLYKRIIRSANDAGRKFELSIKYIEELLDKQNFKCALSGRVLVIATRAKDRSTTTASLDRIDNTKGYIKGNVHWVHKDVNKMKWAFDVDYFIQTCQEISKHTSKRGYQSPGST